MVRILDVAKSKCRIHYKLPKKKNNKETKKSAFLFTLLPEVTHFVSSKTIVQLDHPDVVTTRACLRKHLIRQAERHPIANRIDGAATSERVRNVRPEPSRNQLDRLVFKPVVTHKGFARNNTARSAILVTGLLKKM